MTPHDLMEAARALAEPDHGRPTQARLRRAVSSVYYAMFHTLAVTAADLFIGEARGAAWHRVYRALEHGRARNACQQERSIFMCSTGACCFAGVPGGYPRVRQDIHRIADRAAEGGLCARHEGL